MNYKELAKTNVWGLEAENIRMIEDGEGFDSGGHWNFNKINDKDYEAVYDGLYMHVFASLKDLMARENEIHNYEYDAELSQESGQETFVDSDGNEREYEEKAKNGKDILPLPSPRGYRRLTTGRIGGALEQKLRKNKINIITTPDPFVNGFVVIHVAENDIEKVKAVIGGRVVDDKVIDDIYKEAKARFPSTMEKLSDTPGVNPIGGYSYSNKSDVSVARRADLITLPKEIKGTNCANCMFVKILDEKKGLGFCNHKHVELPVTAKMCCIYWDAEGVLRS